MEKNDNTPLTAEEIDKIDQRTEDEGLLFANTEQSSVIDTPESDDEYKTPVSYENAEEALLAMFIQDDEIATAIAQSGIREIHFRKRKNRVMFPLILNIRSRKGICHYDLVADELEKESMPDGQSVLDFIGGLPELSRIIQCTPGVVDLKVAQSYVDIIFEQFKLSKVKEVSHWLSSQKKFDETKFVDKLTSIQQLINDGTLNKYGLVDLGYLVTDAYTRFEDRRLHPEKYTGLNTGYYWLTKNKVISKGRVCVLGAKTSVGKSVLASNILTELIKDDSKVLLYTPELDKREYVDRMMCAEARLSIDDWKAGTISKVENATYGRAQTKILEKAQNLYIEDKGSQTVAYILNSIKKHMLNRKVDVVIVDYLQKLRYYGDNTKKAITDSMERFCSFAKENDIAFIVISQLRRTEGEPQLSDLKESGDIENFADSVVLLNRNSITKHSERGKGWYKIAKNRQGPVTDNVELLFREDCLKFVEVDLPDDVTDQGTLIGGYDDKIPDEDRPTEQEVVEKIVKEQGTL